jgi:DNA-directed RNA polymerase specialized sigma24 family protein
MPIRPPSVVRVNADTSGGGHAVATAVLGGTAGDGWGRAAAYDAYADGLHTYALWYLRDHDAAADAVYCAFVAADRNHTNLQQPEQIQPWLYAMLRHECRLRASESDPPTPASRRLRPKPDALDQSSVAMSLMQLEGNLRRAEFQSLAWAEAEGLSPAHREVLELSIRHGLDSRGLALVLGLRDGAAGLAPTHGFGLLADAWRELERSLAAAAVAASGRENCAQLAELTFGWSGKLDAALRAPLTEHVDGCSRCQHYLHTVIGTPSAPTILPFVAAPRALRDILLGELADLDAAADAGVDLVALGARSGGFGPEGFPTRVDASSQQGSGTVAAGAGRGPRRRQPGSGRAARPQRPVSPGAARPQPVYKASGAGPSGNAGDNGGTGNGGGSSTVGFTATAAGTAILSGSAGTSTVGFTATAAGTAIIPGSGRDNGSSSQSETPANTFTVTTETAHSPRPRTPQTDDELFSARGSWAEKVLPPEAAPAAAELWRPEPDPGFVQTPSGRFATRPPMADAPPRSRSADIPSRPRTADVPPRPPSTGIPPRPPSANASSRPTVFGADPTIATGPVFPRFSSSPVASSRPAASSPEPVTATTPRVSRSAPSRPAGHGAEPTTTMTATALMSPEPSPTTHLPRFTRPTATTGTAAKPSSPPTSGKPGGPSSNKTPSGTASVRPRHKARPMKQAVVSAMALGAIGAVAAAAAAMLGVTSNPHSNTAALDGSQSSDGLGSASTGTPSSGTGAGRLTVSVTTGSAGSATGGLLTGDTGLGVGLLPGSASAAGTSGTGTSGAASAPTTASAGAFYVSVNQRSADPDSVQILLRNTGGSALKWSAAPSERWLTLSQGSGTLAAGQSVVVTATATSAAPSGQWAAQIVFSPGGIVVTLHGGIPASTGPTSPTSGGGGSTGSGTSTTPSGSGSTTSASPSASATSQSPTPTASASSSQPTAPASDPTTAGTGGSTTTTGGSQPSTPAATDTATAPPTKPPARPGHGH